MVDTYNRRGLHCIVATPGRLNDHLNKKRINMDICKYFVLDEGDRMLDLGFDEEVCGREWVLSEAVVCRCVLLCAVGSCSEFGNRGISCAGVVRAVRISSLFMGRYLLRVVSSLCLVPYECAVLVRLL
jgi:hypothetical protein